MKDLIIGDLHGRKNNIDKVKIVLEECAKLAIDCDRTILLGDIFHEKAYLRTEIVNLYLQYFKKWPSELHLLVGNHDYSNSIECKIHALEVFKDISNVFVHDKFFVEPNTNTIFTQFVHNNEILIDFLLIKQAKEKYILYGHNGIDGCAYSSGSFEQSSLKKEHFKGLKRVFMGHIHKPQSFDNITYVGTPFTKDYGEANEIKRVIIYDHKTDQTQDIFLPIPMHKVLKYEIKSVRGLAKINKELKELNTTNIKLIIDAPKSVAKKIELESFEIPIDSLKVESTEEAKEAKSISETLTTEEMCDEYLKGLDTEFIFEELSELNREILKEARL